MNRLTLKLTTPDDADAVKLQDELSEILYKRFNSDGRNSFQDWKRNDNRYIFVVIYNDNEPVGWSYQTNFKHDSRTEKNVCEAYPARHWSKDIANS